MQTGLAHFASIRTPRGGTRDLFAEIRGTTAIVNQGLRVERVTINNLLPVYSKISEEIVNIPEDKFSRHIEITSENLEPLSLGCIFPAVANGWRTVEQKSVGAPQGFNFASNSVLGVVCP